MVYEFEFANDGRAFDGGAARLLDAVAVIGDERPGVEGSDEVLDEDNTGKLDKLLLLMGATRGIVPVCEGVREGVPLGFGVETDEEGRSSQAMTSKALPPAGISRATWFPLFLPDPTRVAKSTSPPLEVV